MCKDRREAGAREETGVWGLPACLPGKGLPAQPDPKLHPLGLGFGSFPCAGPLHPGSSKQHKGSLLGRYGGWVAHQPRSCRAWCLCCWEAEEGAAGAKGTWEQTCSSLGNGGAWTCSYTGTVRPAREGPRDCSPAPPNTPKHLHLIFPQRGGLQEHPEPAPVTKEPMDRHRLGRREEDRTGKESSGVAGQASS